MRIARIPLAFTCAPIGALVAVGLFALVVSGAQPIGFYVSVVAYAYISTFVLGVPTFLFTRARNMRSVLPIVLAAIALAAVPAVFFLLMFSSISLSVAMLVGGAGAGLVFWAVAYGA